MTDADDALRRLAEAAVRQPLPWDEEQCACLHMEDGSRIGDCFYCVQVARSRVRHHEDLASFNRRGTPDVVIGLLDRLAAAERLAADLQHAASLAGTSRTHEIMEAQQQRAALRDRAEKAEAALGALVDADATCHVCGSDVDVEATRCCDCRPGDPATEDEARMKRDAALHAARALLATPPEPRR